MLDALLIALLIGWIDVRVSGVTSNLILKSFICYNNASFVFNDFIIFERKSASKTIHKLINEMLFITIFGSFKTFMIE